MTNNRIEKRITLKAPISRVWRALTNYREFGEWFRVKLESPFVVGQPTSGFILYPGYEHLRMEVIVQTMDPERLFTFTWHPAAIDPNVDYSHETPTLVEFRLQESPEGTILTLSESGFEHLPDARRAIALRGNDGGWTEQMKNIEAYVAKTS